jgi:tetratricopeptide (TPR) repeat protein
MATLGSLAFAQSPVVRAQAQPQPTTQPAEDAAAQAEAERASAGARKHYEEGNKAFSLGEFPRAIDEFRKAYNLKPDPRLLYNIAQAYRLSDDPGKAIFFYRSYLRNFPEAANRRDVEDRIIALETRLEEKKASQPAAPTPGAKGPPSTPEGAPAPAAASIASTTTLVAAAPAPAPAPVATADAAHAPLYKRWWFWTAAAGVLAIGLVATVALSGGGAPRSDFPVMRFP